MLLVENGVICLMLNKHLSFTVFDTELCKLEDFRARFAKHWRVCLQ